MLVEDIKSIIDKCDKRELRKFGVTVGVFLGILAGVLFWREKGLYETFAWASALLLSVGLAVPVILKPLYIVWMSLALTMGFAMTRVILSLLFAILFTPAGLVMRPLGKDPLNEKIDRSKTSYWIARQRHTFDPKSVEVQY